MHSPGQLSARQFFIHMVGEKPPQMKNISVDMKTVCFLIYVKLTVRYLSITYIYIYTHELMVKPMKFLWLLLEIEVLKEEQADSILTGYHKISDTKSHTSFHFYATLLLEKCFGEKNTWGSFPFSAYGDKEL